MSFISFCDVGRHLHIKFCIAVSFIYRIFEMFVKSCRQRGYIAKRGLQLQLSYIKWDFSINKKIFKLNFLKCNMNFYNYWTLWMAQHLGKHREDNDFSHHLLSSDPQLSLGVKILKFQSRRKQASKLELSVSYMHIQLLWE